MKRRGDATSTYLRGIVLAPSGGVVRSRLAGTVVGRVPDETRQAALVPVCLRLEMVGTAKAVDLGYRTTGEAPGAFTVWRHGHQVDERRAVPGVGTVRLELGKGDPDSRAVVYLPEAALPEVRSVTAVRGLLEPAPVEPRWLVVGDAVARGRGASSPARTWAAIVGRKSGVDTVNLGFDGLPFDGTLFAEILDGQVAAGVTVCGTAAAWARATHLDGTVRETHPDHTVRETHPDHTVRETHPDHTVRETHPDHTVRETHPDHTVRETHPDGTVRETHPDGTVRETHPDGTVRETLRRALLAGIRQALPAVPVVVVSPFDGSEEEGTTHVRTVLEEAVEELRAGGDPLLTLVPGREILGVEHLVDGVHPDDEGHTRLAAKLANVVHDLLQAHGAPEVSVPRPELPDPGARHPSAGTIFGEEFFQGGVPDAPDHGFCGGRRTGAAGAVGADDDPPPNGRIPEPSART